MPKTKRDFLRRYLAHAHSDVYRAEEHLAALYATFDPAHPEYADFISLMLTTLEQVREWMHEFATHAWGAAPEDWDKWRNLRDS